ncbi:MAG: hypothetical protein ACREPH_04275 [Rhodanobacteraceae bacterium]
MRVARGFVWVASLIFLAIAVAHATRFQEWVAADHYAASGVVVWLVMMLVPLVLSLWGFVSLRRIGR